MYIYKPFTKRAWKIQGGSAWDCNNHNKSQSRCRQDFWKDWPEMNLKAHHCTARSRRFRWCPSSLAKLVYNSNFTRTVLVDISIVFYNGIINQLITGRAPSCTVLMCSFWMLTSTLTGSRFPGPIQLL